MESILLFEETNWKSSKVLAVESTISRLCIMCIICEYGYSGMTIIEVFKGYDEAWD